MELKVINPAQVPTPAPNSGEVPFFVDSLTGQPAFINASGETEEIGGGGSSSAGIISQFTANTVEANAPVISYGIALISSAA